MYRDSAERLYIVEGKLRTDSAAHLDYAVTVAKASGLPAKVSEWVRDGDPNGSKQGWRREGTWVVNEHGQRA